MAAWAFSLAFLGIDIARLSGFRPDPAFLNEAALPFFLLGWPLARFKGFLAVLVVLIHTGISYGAVGSFSQSLVPCTTSS